MNTNELLKDIYNKFDTGEYVKIPSIRKIGESKWVVYFYENGLIHNGIYYTEERARRKLEQVNGGQNGRRYTLKNKFYIVRRAFSVANLYE